MDINIKENTSENSKGKTPDSINCNGEKVDYKEFKKRKEG